MKKIINLILAGVGTAMGIVVVVLSVLDSTASTQTFITLLGIGLFAIGLLCLNNLQKMKD